MNQDEKEKAAREAAKNQKKSKKFLKHFLTLVKREKLSWN
jgi:hypothetical protein